jgi:hypothetical protein
MSVNDLSDMEFDEVSFVREGINQAAHVVLVKGEGVEPDPRDVAVGYLIAKGGLDLADAEAVVEKADPTDPMESVLASVKTGESAMAAVRTAGSRVLAEELAEELLEYNPSLTRAQALARTYEANPQLYQAELSASQLATNRQTLRNDEAKRFA